MKESGDIKVDEVTISQVYGGMRNIKSLVTDISFVDPNEGIRFRGMTVPEALEKLPRLSGAEMPLVGGLYCLFLVGNVPTFDEAMEVEDEWKARSQVPEYVFDTLRAMPRDAHPMTLFAGNSSMQPQSVFFKRYHEGIRKDEHWIPMLEDSLNLTAKLPVIAASLPVEVQSRKLYPAKSRCSIGVRTLRT